VDILITPFTGKTLPLSEEVEDNTQEKTHHLPNMLLNNSDHTKTFKKNSQRNLSQFKDQDGDGLLGTISPNLSELLKPPTKKCWPHTD